MDFNKHLNSDKYRLASLRQEFLYANPIHKRLEALDRHALSLFAIATYARMATRVFSWLEARDQDLQYHFKRLKIDLSDPETLEEELTTLALNNDYELNKTALFWPVTLYNAAGLVEELLDQSYGLIAANSGEEEIHTLFEETGFIEHLDDARTCIDFFPCNLDSASPEVAVTDISDEAFADYDPSELDPEGFEDYDPELDEQLEQMLAEDFGDEFIDEHDEEFADFEVAEWKLVEDHGTKLACKWAYDAMFLLGNLLNALTAHDQEELVKTAQLLSLFSLYQVRNHAELKQKAAVDFEKVKELPLLEAELDYQWNLYRLLTKDTPAHPLNPQEQFEKNRQKAKSARGRGKPVKSQGKTTWKEVVERVVDYSSYHLAEDYQ